MKTVIASAVSLILGPGLGWYFEHHRAEREKTGIVRQMVEGGESSDGEHAARAARAIQFIESGEPQEAVRLLSGPIAYDHFMGSGQPMNAVDKWGNSRGAIRKRTARKLFL